MKFTFWFLENLQYDNCKLLGIIKYTDVFLKINKTKFYKMSIKINFHLKFFPSVQCSLNYHPTLNQLRKNSTENENEKKNLPRNKTPKLRSHSIDSTKQSSYQDELKTNGQLMSLRNFFRLRLLPFFVSWASPFFKAKQTRVSCPRASNAKRTHQFPIFSHSLHNILIFNCHPKSKVSFRCHLWTSSRRNSNLFLCQV